MCECYFCRIQCVKLLLALLYDSLLLHFNNYHIIDKSRMICTQMCLYLGVWSPLRQTGMWNSPQQFEAVAALGYLQLWRGELHSPLLGLLDSHRGGGGGGGGGV